MARNISLNSTPITAFSVAEEDKLLAPLRNNNKFFKQRKITQRADALNKCRDTFDKINAWEEMLEYHHEN